MKVAVLFLFALSAFANTTVVQTIVGPDGTPVNAKILLTVNVPCVSPTGTYLSGRVTAIAVLSGALSTSLVPTDTCVILGAGVTGTVYYTATWVTCAAGSQLGVEPCPRSGSSWTERWIVPTTGSTLTASSLVTDGVIPPTSSLAAGGLVKALTGTGRLVIASAGTDFASATNGTSGQALTSNAAGGFGTPVTLGSAALQPTSAFDAAGAAATAQAAAIAASAASLAAFTGTPNITTVGTLGSLAVAGPITWAGGAGTLSPDPSGGIELGPNNAASAAPYVDFHFGIGSVQDYNARILNDADGQLSVLLAAGGRQLRITSAGVDSPNGNFTTSLTVAGQPLTSSRISFSPHDIGNVGVSVDLSLNDGGGPSGVFVQNVRSGSFNSQRVSIKTAEGNVTSATEHFAIEPDGTIVMDRALKVGTLSAGGVMKAAATTGQLGLATAGTDFASATNGTNGKVLTSDGTGGFGTPVTLAPVATSGLYADLTSKPTIPTVAITTSVLKGNGSGGAVAASSTNDYVIPFTSRPNGYIYTADGSGGIRGVSTLFYNPVLGTNTTGSVGFNTITPTLSLHLRNYPGAQSPGVQLENRFAFTNSGSTITITRGAADYTPVDGDRVRVGIAIAPVGVAVPSPLLSTLTYFVVNSSGSTLQLSLTLGGSPIVLTTTGIGAELWKTDEKSNRLYMLSSKAIFDAVSDDGTNSNTLWQGTKIGYMWQNMTIFAPLTFGGTTITAWQRATFGNTCITSAVLGALCDTSYTWPGAAFASSTYQVSCTLTGNNISGVPVIQKAYSKSATQIAVTIVALDNNAAQNASVDCVAFQ